MIFSMRKFMFENNAQMFLWVAGFVVNIVTLLLVYYHIAPTPEPLALHYNVVFGVDVFGPGTSLYRIPFIGFAVLFVNVLISKLVKSPGSFLSYLAGFVSFIVSIILLAAILFVIKIN